MAAPAISRLPGRPALRVGPVSVVWRPRVLLVAVLGLVVLVLGVALNVGIGEVRISVPDVLVTLFGGGDPGQRFIVMGLRLPRSLTGALVGAALAASGAITQAIARNPLASPDVIGFTAGASAAAVFVIVAGSGFGAVGFTASAVGLPLAALVGGLISALTIYGLAWRKGVQGFRLVLVGIGINAMLIAIVHWLLVIAQVTDAARAYTWINGSLNGRGWEHVVPVGVALVVLVPAALVLAHVLGALQLSDDSARALGIRVDKERTLLLLTAVGLCSVATASAGPFVALVAPQIAQRAVGTSRPPITVSLVFGAALTVVADLLARTAFGTELPVGIITAVLGAPYLLFLIARHGRKARA
jgi:iron complex transport system permease protein